MKWNRSDLLKSPSANVTFDEDVSIDPSAFDGNSRINSVLDVHVSGTGFLDEDADRFYAEMHISGTMMIPDAITGEEIEYPFETDCDEVYGFEETEEDDVRVVTDEVIELYPAIVDAIMLEVPLQVTNADSEQYPHGDGWRVISEEDYEREQADQTDPRLAKLKQFKEEK
ncbi:MAG: DUF177 domain-containing protein [Solobacterium sp.]|nr:DUF177 domain-containing protein [Solobacterium sp.]